MVQKEISRRDVALTFHPYSWQGSKRVVVEFDLQNQHGSHFIGHSCHDPRANY
jgi:hypothetical protein